MVLRKHSVKLSSGDDFRTPDRKYDPTLPIRSRIEEDSNSHNNATALASRDGQSIHLIDPSGLLGGTPSFSRSSTMKTEYDSSWELMTPPEWTASQSTLALPEQTEISDKLRANSQCGNEFRLEVEVVQQDRYKKILITMFPPSQPPQDIPHVPVDIVLVIDVSGSMDRKAPFPDNIDADEDPGLTILDLTKHAARTVLESLNDGDRLGIVKFSTASEVVQKLTPMNDHNKKATIEKIEALEAAEATNLWGGLCDGLSLFEEAEHIGNVPGMYVLTDGMPNHMNPAQGFVKRLTRLLNAARVKHGVAPTIHTFGFGYGILSDLMHSIAEVGRGNFSFIADVGMIGTVFVHAVANLFSTFATDVRLEIESKYSELLLAPSFFEQELTHDSSTLIHLGSLRHGQPRSVILRCDNAFDGSMSGVIAQLCCQIAGLPTFTMPVNIDFCSHSGFQGSPAYAFHKARHEFCDAIADLYPRTENGERQQRINAAQIRNILLDVEAVGERITNSNIGLEPQDTTIQHLNSEGLLDDITGQVRLALLTYDQKTGPKKIIEQTSFFQRWGRHYLASILHAHAHEVCNSFKDPGPLRYGIDSPLFIKCRDELDVSFDTLPAPKKRIKYPTMLDYQCSDPRMPISMARYNRYGNPCFLGSCPVRTGADSTSRIDDLEVGQSIWTLDGMRRIAAIIKTPMAERALNAQICGIGSQGLYITPYHPISYGGEWIMPISCPDASIKSLKMNTTIFSLVLEPSPKPDAHTVEVGGVICTTLGHGLTRPDTSDVRVTLDVRTHKFFGDYYAVMSSLQKLAKDGRGRHISSGVRKDPVSGLACDFIDAYDVVWHFGGDSIQRERFCTTSHEGRTRRRAQLSRL